MDLAHLLVAISLWCNSSANRSECQVKVSNCIREIHVSDYGRDALTVECFQKGLK